MKNRDIKREIKFRAWNKERKEMYLFDLYSFDSDDGSQWLNCDANKILNYGGDEWNNCEIMQFTGLKDKNGKEIYEGDILQYKHYNATKRWWSHTEEIPEIKKEVEQQRQKYNTDQHVVEFSNGCFEAGYPIKGDDISRGQLFDSGTRVGSDYEERYWDFEVIGNIYENPELV